jgi:hypothetical protein
LLYDRNIVSVYAPVNNILNGGVVNTMENKPRTISDDLIAILQIGQAGNREAQSRATKRVTKFITGVIGFSESMANQYISESLEKIQNFQKGE